MRLTLLLLAAALLCAQDKDAASFDGTVIDSVSHQPIAKAGVQLTPVQRPKIMPVWHVGRTAADGHIHFDGITPSDYHLQVTARGYADSTPMLLRFTAGQNSTGMSLPLDPQAVVTGRVVDPQGEPVPGALVAVIRPKWQKGVRIFENFARTTADDRGEYRLNVVPGRYYLAAEALAGPNANDVFTEAPGKPELRLGDTYYPGAPGIEGASPIELHPGQQMAGTDFKLAAVVTHHIRGKITSDDASVIAPHLAALYVVSRNGDPLRRLIHAAVDNNGVFDAPGLVSGTYRLDLLQVRDGPTAASIDIAVTDRDVNGVNLPGMPQFPMKGHVQWEEEPTLPAISDAKLQMTPLEWSLLQGASSFSPSRDGTLPVSYLRCDVYSLTMPPITDLYIKAINLGGKPVSGSKLDLRNGAPGELEVVLAKGTGTVGGTVAAGSGMQAVLVAADGETGTMGAHGVEIDPAGQFQFPFVPPGHWRVFAAPSFDEGLWQSAEFVKQIENRGVLVELEKKGAAQVQVSMLSADDIERAADKVKQ